MILENCQLHPPILWNCSKLFTWGWPKLQWPYHMHLFTSEPQPYPGVWYWGTTSSSPPILWNCSNLFTWGWHQPHWPFHTHLFMELFKLVYLGMTSAPLTIAHTLVHTCSSVTPSDLLEPDIGELPFPSPYQTIQTCLLGDDPNITDHIICICAKTCEPQSLYWPGPLSHELIQTCC